MPAGTVIKPRGDTASSWAATNPVLSLRELGIETDTGAFKFGDGATAWTGLAYAGHVLPGALISLTNPNGSNIDFGAAGVGTPANGTTPTPGQKITLYRLRSANDSDIAIGATSSMAWVSVGGTSVAGRVFRVYTSGTQRLEVNGNGITVSGWANATNYQNSQVTRTADVTLATTSPATNLMDASAAVRTVTLYSSAASPGQRFVIRKTDASANSVVVQVAGAGTLLAPRGGGTTFTLFNQHDTVEVESTATAGVWLVVATNVRDGSFNNVTAGATVQTAALRVTGDSKLGNFRTVTGATYDWGTTGDKWLEVQTCGCVVTLPDPTTKAQYDYYVINTSTGNITLTGRAAAQTIGNTSTAAQTYTLPAGATLHIVNNGTLWRIV